MLTSSKTLCPLPVHGSGESTSLVKNFVSSHGKKYFFLWHSMLSFAKVLGLVTFAVQMEIISDVPVSSMLRDRPLARWRIAYKLVVTHRNTQSQIELELNAG